MGHLGTIRGHLELKYLVINFYSKHNPKTTPKI